MALGERIKTCRQNAGMSQEKVAELVGVSRQAVTKWEVNQSAPNTENLFKLAEIFGTTVDMLLASEDEVKQSPAEQIYYLYKMFCNNNCTIYHIKRSPIFFRIQRCCSTFVYVDICFLHLNKSIIERSSSYSAEGN